MFFKIFEKMLEISLYWFAAQQFFYVEFSAKFNELSLFFLEATGSGKKMAKIKLVRKDASSRHSEAKG